MLPTTKEIHDNIWGTVRLTKAELAVLDHPLMQRLRRISQLGFVNVVYPGAGDSRLAHSLGVMTLASRVGDHLLRIGDLDEEEVTAVRIAALVHDVGHYPLSHSTESFYTDIGGLSLNHEELSARIITSTTLTDKINNCLENSEITTNDIADLIRGRETENIKKSAMWQLLNSQFDLDRMDYFLRDTIAVGLDYGRIDFRRILSNLVVDKETGNLGVDVKARTAIENYILARYYLWDTVYLHKVVMGFEIIQKEACRLLVKEGLLPDSNQIMKKVGIDEDWFCEFDDSYFWTKLYEGMKKKGNGTKLKELGRMLRDRDPLRLAFELPADLPPSIQYESVTPQIESGLPYLDQSYAETKISPEIVSPEWYFAEDVRLSVYKFVPVMEPEFYEPEKREKALRDRSKTIRLYRSNGRGRKFVGFLAIDPNSIIFPLNKFEKRSIRFYTHPQFKEKLREYFISELC